MSTFQTLQFSKRNGVAHISLDRPEVLNAYNIQMRDDFSEALAAVRDDPDIRTVLISGNGRAFCAGADLTEFGTAPSQAVARQVRWERDVWGQLMDLEQPVVAAIHGYCIGSGVEIALLSDLRIAARDTIFALPEVRLGMIPAAGGTQTLPRNVGSSTATDLLLTGRRFDAEEALRLGLITRLVEPDALLDTAEAVAEQLAAVGENLLGAVKRSLREGADLRLKDALELETMLAAQCWGR
jgi:enoyl-CoA hydratase/carnithine racemase